MSLRVRAVGRSALVDADEARRALALLADPTPFSYCVLFSLPSARGRARLGTEIGELIEDLDELCDDPSVYVHLNPATKRINSKVPAREILRRRWLFLDIDPHKPHEHKDNPASDAEHEATRQAAETVRLHLASLGWPAPVLIDSGNGYYLLWRVHLPNDKQTQAVVRRWTQHMGSLVSTLASVDRSVHNADRVARLPGTLNRKGVQSDDRPWRPCRLVFVPDTLEEVSYDQIVAATPTEDVPQPSTNGAHKPPSRRGLVLQAGTSAAKAYARKALDNCCADVAMASPGDRNNALNKAAYSLGGLVPGGYLTRQEIESRLTEEARRIRLHEDPGCGEAGIANTIRSGIESGMGEPREIRGDPPPEPASNAVPEGELIIIRASSIKPRKVEWLWPGRIPLGKLTTFAGVGGLGKTFVLCDMTARISSGNCWPDSGGECTEPGQVLFVSGEDEADDTLVPRMIELGANLDKIVFLKTEVQDQFTLSDLKTLDLALDQAGPNLRFVAIDPPTAYLGDINDHRNSELRRLLTPLKSWAAKRRVAIVFNTHVTKPQGQKVEAMMRVMGSVAWVNAVRAAHMFARDPADHDRRLFCPMKLNIGPELKALSYRLQVNGDMARIEWLGEVDVTADEAMNKERRKKRNVVAADWLEQIFAQSSELKSEVIWKEKEHTDLSRNAILEAKDQMGIRARQATDGEGQKCWIWSWPDAARQAWKDRNGPPTQAAAGGEVEF